MGLYSQKISKIVFIDLYVNQKKSGLEIARFFGISRTTVSRYIKMYGLEPRSISEVRKNKYWGPSSEQRRKLSELGKSQVGKNNPYYKGGHINKYGYRLIRIEGKYRKEHRWVMSQYLGRELSINEDVHHINGDKLDNQLENLELMSKSEHSRLHWSSPTKRKNQSSKIKQVRSERFWSTKPR